MSDTYESKEIKIVNENAHGSFRDFKPEAKDLIIYLEVIAGVLFLIAIILRNYLR